MAWLGANWGGGWGAGPGTRPDLAWFLHVSPGLGGLAHGFHGTWSPWAQWPIFDPWNMTFGKQIRAINDDQWHRHGMQSALANRQSTSKFVCCVTSTRVVDQLA